MDPYGAVFEPPLKGKIKLETIPNANPEKLHGNVSLWLTNGDEVNGFWRGGKREGAGSLYSTRMEQEGIERLCGNYEDGCLSGQGKLIMKDLSYRYGWFQCGYFHGPCLGNTGEGEVNYVGWYKAGLPAGLAWQAVRGNGWLVGHLDLQGKFTGDEIAFLYPDLSTAIVGKFENGQLVAGQAARVTGIVVTEGIIEPKFTLTDERLYKRGVSTIADIACDPHLPDPYERTLVEVCSSKIGGAGEGLYAKQKIPADTIIAYYNGLRMTGPGNICEEETGYAIFVDVNIRKNKNAEHMDIPQKYQCLEGYSASLAHKVNHSFTPNTAWSNADHPVFGFVPAIKTMEELNPGDEITVHYRMDMDVAPEWYAESWDLHTNSFSS